MEYLVIDTESCTGRADDGSLCSLGYAICDENLNVLKQEDILFNPLPKRFMVGDKKNSKRTGVTFAYEVEEFRASPRFEALYGKVKQLFEGRTVLGFSMSNDVKYLNNACDVFSLPRIEYKFYDVQFIYQLLHPEDTAIGLKTLNTKYGIDYVEHRADEDAAASIVLLKNILYLEKTTLNEVIDKYKIFCGENTKDGYHFCYSQAVMEGLYGLKISKRIQSIIFSDYLHNLPIVKRPLEKVCFSHKIEKGEIDFTRTLIDLSHKRGYAYTHDTDVCTIYVTDDKCDKRISHLSERKKQRLKIFSLSEYCEHLGYQKDNEYRDVKFLTEYFKTLTF